MRAQRRGCPTHLGVVGSSAEEVTFGQGSEACVRVHLFIQKLWVPFRKWSKTRVFFKKFLYLKCNLNFKRFALFKK